MRGCIVTGECLTVQCTLRVLVCRAVWPCTAPVAGFMSRGVPPWVSRVLPVTGDSVGVNTRVWSKQCIQPHLSFTGGVRVVRCPLLAASSPVVLYLPCWTSGASLSSSGASARLGESGSCGVQSALVPTSGLLSLHGCHVSLPRPWCLCPGYCQCVVFSLTSGSCRLLHPHTVCITHSASSCATETASR